jgi:hypothetical protein
VLATISNFNKNTNKSLNDEQVGISSINFVCSTILHLLLVKNLAVFVGNYFFLLVLVVCVVSIPCPETVNEAFFFSIISLLSSSSSSSRLQTHAEIIIVVMVHTSVCLFINNNRFLLLDRLLAQKLVHPFISIMLSMHACKRNLTWIKLL